MSIPPLAFKIATQLIEEQLLPQATEAADVPVGQAQEQNPWQGTALSLLAQRSPSATATEPAPKVVTDIGSKAQ